MVFFLFSNNISSSVASDLGLHCLPMSHKMRLGLNGLYRAMSTSVETTSICIALYHRQYTSKLQKGNNTLKGQIFEQ